jgi:hypothetical protein
MIATIVTRDGKRIQWNGPADVWTGMGHSLTELRKERPIQNRKPKAPKSRKRF